MVEGSSPSAIFGLTDVRRMAADLRTLSPDWQVGALARRTPRCSADEELAEVVARLQEINVVLIPGADGKDGLLTSNGLLVILARLAEPFLVIADIESSIRTVLDKRIPVPERAAVLEDVLGSGPDRPAPQALDELSMGEYERLIGAKRMWPRFKDVYRNQEIVRFKLARVRSLRNQLFHFRGELDPEDLTDLKRHRWWFQDASLRAVKALDSEPSSAGESGDVR